MNGFSHGKDTGLIVVRTTIYAVVFVASEMLLVENAMAWTLPSQTAGALMAAWTETGSLGNARPLFSFSTAAGIGLSLLVLWVLATTAGVAVYRQIRDRRAVRRFVDENRQRVIKQLAKPKGSHSMPKSDETASFSSASSRASSAFGLEVAPASDAAHVSDKVAEFPHDIEASEAVVEKIAYGQTEGQKLPKVLCIDDDPDFSRAVKLRLEPYGVDVIRAFSGEQGFWMGLDERPDVIITDLKMPDGEGNYVLGRFRGHPLTENIPIIVMTSNANPGVKRQMLGIGAEAYLTKPLVFDELLRELRQYLTLPREPQPTKHLAEVL